MRGESGDAGWKGSLGQMAFREKGDKAAFQVIVLGATGGPREDSVTGLLVRSTSTKWSSNSVVAVDAGTLVAGIIRALDRHMSDRKDGDGRCDFKGTVMKEGPFVGLELPNETAQANAAHIFRDIIGAILITHPHLDHVSGLAMNTPLVEAGSGPKTVSALPSTIAALKNHVFNDITWPNLSDENGGAGLVTYQRLSEGGNPRFGRGDSRGYVKAGEGLVTKCLGVSHGRCRQRYHPESGKHHRSASAVFTAESLLLPSRGSISGDAQDPSHYSPSIQPLIHPGGSSGKDPNWAPVESSAFFIRDENTGSEIIVFGDIEPDSVSMEPRNRFVWEAAAPKIASGTLRAIFIECSYDDSVDDNSLYGHLCPRHLVAELQTLATKVLDKQKPSRSSAGGKRKRQESESVNDDRPVSPKTKRVGSTGTRKSSTCTGTQPERRSHRRSGQSNPGESAGAEVPDLVYDEQQTPSIPDPLDDGDDGADADDPNAQGNILWAESTPLPLAGLSVYIIHIKETLTDGPPPGNRILQELRTQGEAAGLGCEFYVPMSGEGVWI